MPKKEQHLAIAKHNERFVSSFDLKQTQFRDWAVTAVFYAALHYVEAYMASQSFHSPDHRTRDTALTRFAATKRIFDDYNDLKNHSINARYFGKNFTEADVLQDVLPCLEAVKKELLPLL